MSIKSVLVWRIIPSIALAVAAAIGWFASHDRPMGVFFATLIPVMKGILPPTIVGHGKMKGTPPVPDDLMPQPRPEGEMFLELPGGYKFPQNGLGMCCRPTAYDDVLVYRTVLWYLLLGGRHIDGADLYLNHKAIGKAIKEAMIRGVPREEIFMTTKTFPTEFGRDSVMEIVPQYLEELGLEYIDLLLLHGPAVFPGLSSPCLKEGKSNSECRKETWLALTQLRDKGMIRNIGVSNFVVKHLEELQGVGAPIANNQINYHPFVPDHVQEVVAYCKEHGITITAYSPLGGMIDIEKSKTNLALEKLAEKYNKRWSTIMIRWAIQSNCAVIPGTGNPEHMKENLSAYDFKISDDDMDGINGLANTDGFGYFMDTRDLD